jgi:predicted N-acetyltransferase YhbS
VDAARSARLADPVAGCWEAGDVAWWWRQRRSSDDLPTHVWSSDTAVVRAVRPITWRTSATIETFGVPDVVPASEVVDAIEATAAAAGAHSTSVSRTPEGGWHDAAVVDELLRRGWRLGTMDGGGGWLEDLPDVTRLPGDVHVARVSDDEGARHHMADRFGDEIQVRLRQTGIYDHRFDLIAVDDAGNVIASALGWFDAVTRVRFVEPVAVVKSRRREGIARGLLTRLLRSLTQAGAPRMRINWERDGAASGLYRELGFDDSYVMGSLIRESRPSST